MLIRFFRRSITCLIVSCLLLTAVNMLSPRGILPLSVEKTGISQYEIRLSDRTFRLDLRRVKNAFESLCERAQALRRELPAWLTEARERIAQAWESLLHALGVQNRHSVPDPGESAPDHALFAFTNGENCDTMA